MMTVKQHLIIEKQLESDIGLAYPFDRRSPYACEVPIIQRKVSKVKNEIFSGGRAP